MESDPEEFKDQITSIVRKSKIKFKTKPKTTRSVAKVTNTKCTVAKIDLSQIRQSKVDHEPETVLIGMKNPRDQMDSDNDSMGHTSKRCKVEGTVPSQNKQSIRTIGKKCSRVESDSDNDSIENGPLRQKAKPPDSGDVDQQKNFDVVKQKAQTSEEEAMVKLQPEFDKFDAFMELIKDDSDYPSDHGSDTDVSDSDSDMCDYLSDVSLG